MCCRVWCAIGVGWVVSGRDRKGYGVGEPEWVMMNMESGDEVRAAHKRIGFVN